MLVAKRKNGQTMFLPLRAAEPSGVINKQDCARSFPVAESCCVRSRSRYPKLSEFPRDSKYKLGAGPYSWSWRKDNASTAKLQLLWNGNGRKEGRTKLFCLQTRIVRSCPTSIAVQLQRYSKLSVLDAGRCCWGHKPKKKESPYWISIKCWRAVWIKTSKCIYTTHTSLTALYMR